MSDTPVKSHVKSPAKPRGKNITARRPRYHGKDKRSMKLWIHQLETLKGRKLTRGERDSAITIQNSLLGTRGVE